MTPSDLAAFMADQKLDHDQLGERVRVTGRTVRRWLDGTREIPGMLDVVVWFVKQHGWPKRRVVTLVKPTAPVA